jgi:hypothetical protein
LVLDVAHDCFDEQRDAAEGVALQSLLVEVAKESFDDVEP